MIKNIVFDMGNVIIRFDPDLFMEIKGVSDADKNFLKREVFQSLEWVRMDRGSLTDAEAADIICARIPDRLRKTARSLVEMWDTPILPIEDMYNLVKELKEAGYKVYLLSNASIRQPDYWSRVPAAKFFDGTLISAFEHLVKPQPEIYRLLCDRFSLEPEECVFIDDEARNAEGAFLCGINALVFHGDAHEIRIKLKELGVKVTL